MTTSPPVGRLAPTPSGKLHLGNACAFAAAWLSVRSQHGTLLLRFEDVDTTRARTAIEESQRRDLEWLGLEWDREVTRQSERDYQPALRQLGDRIYHCACTRASIRDAGGIHPDALCQKRGTTQGAIRYKVPPDQVSFTDRRWGVRHVTPNALGDRRRAPLR
ncbi:MAG: glutamate--tRNA ligase family protein [Myxococcota bacterium]